MFLKTLKERIANWYSFIQGIFISVFYQGLFNIRN